jgi:hypothetical protein
MAKDISKFKHANRIAWLDSELTSAMANYKTFKNPTYLVIIKRLKKEIVQEVKAGGFKNKKEALKLREKTL